MSLTANNLALEDGFICDPVYDALTQSRRSLANGLQKAPVFLTYLARLLKCTRAFFVQTTEIALNVPNVELKIAPDEFGVVSGRLGVAWNIWPQRWQTRFGRRTSGQKYQQNYNLCTSGAVQPKGA